MAGVKILNLPSLGTSLSSSAYLPISQSSITYKVTIEQLIETVTTNYACRLATTGNLTASYDNGSSGVGATLTNSGALAALSIDGVSVSLDDRILVKDQSAQEHNGIYFVLTAGDASTAWVLERATDYDEASDVDAGDFFTVAFGTTNSKTQWIQTAAGPFTIGTTAITFASNILAGSGLLKTNNTLSLTTSMTNGQLFIGSTGLPPVSATLTAGSGITITNGAGSISIESNTTTEVTTTSESMTVNKRYIANNAALVSLLLPATSAVGDFIIVVGKGAGGWTITQDVGQKIQIGSSASTPGVGGSVASSAQFDTVKLVCLVADSVWSAEGAPESGGLVIT